MGQIGQRLAEARMARGLSLEQVQEITKIRVKYLEALEAEDWSALPGEVYLRGFLKSYAKVVGLDPQELLSLYQPPPPPPTDPIPVATTSVRPVSPHDQLAPNSIGRLSGGYQRVHRRSSRRSLLSVLVVVVLLLGAAYLGYRHWQPSTLSEPSPPPTPAEDNTSVTSPATDSSGKDQPQQTSPTTTVPSVQLTKQSETPLEVRYLVTSAQPLELKVGIQEAAPGAPIGECWIDVQCDARNVGDTMLRSGRTQEYTANETLYLRLGNPQVAGLLININGVEVPRPQTNEAVNLIFTRQNP